MAAKRKRRKKGKKHIGIRTFDELQAKLKLRKHKK